MHLIYYDKLANPIQLATISNNLQISLTHNILDKLLWSNNINQSPFHNLQKSVSWHHIITAFLYVLKKAFISLQMHIIQHNLQGNHSEKGYIKTYIVSQYHVNLIPPIFTPINHAIISRNATYLSKLLYFELNGWWWCFHRFPIWGDWGRFDLFLELINLILDSPYSPPLPPQIPCPQGIEEQTTQHNGVYESKCSSLQYPKLSTNSKCILCQQQSYEKETILITISVRIVATSHIPTTESWSLQD